MRLSQITFFVVFMILTWSVCLANHSKLLKSEERPYREKIRQRAEKLYRMYDRYSRNGKSCAQLIGIGKLFNMAQAMEKEGIRLSDMPASVLQYSMAYEEKFGYKNAYDAFSTEGGRLYTFSCDADILKEYMSEDEVQPFIYIGVRYGDSQLVEHMAEGRKIRQDTVEEAEKTATEVCNEYGESTICSSVQNALAVLNKCYLRQ